MTVRILEIGKSCLFKKVYPENTTWLQPNVSLFTKFQMSLAPPFVSRNLIPEIRQRLRDGYYHLIVYLPPGVPTNAPKKSNPRWSTGQKIEQRSLSHKIVTLLLGDAMTTPLAVLDMEDTDAIDPRNLFLFDRCKAYFKREMPSDPVSLLRLADFTTESAVFGTSRFAERLLAKLRPISLGLSRVRIAAAPAVIAEKTTDIFFAGSVKGRPVREQGLPYLRSLASKGIRVEESRGFPLEEYMRRCACAWLVWSPEGLGRDCFRHYEAPLCHSVPIINRAPVNRYRPLVEGVHCFYYDPFGDDLARVILNGLRDKPRLLTMAQAGHEHVLEHHTHEALCRYIMEKVL
jgi:hypothetical protein